MKTLVHTDKELIEATIKKCDICYVGLADIRALNSPPMQHGGYVRQSPVRLQIRQERFVSPYTWWKPSIS